MNQYRRPAGHSPCLPPSTDHSHAGRWVGLCAAVILAGMIFLSLHSIARVACGPAAHPDPCLDILPATYPDATLAAPSEQAGQAPLFVGVEVDA